MKRALLVLSLLLVSSAAQAQRLIDTTAALRDYASKILPRCPGGTLTLEPIGAGGPANFNTYVAQLRSTDKYCGTQKYLMHSPKTGQILVGQVVSLPADARPAAARITEQATQMLNKQVKATVSPFPLPDGIKAVNIARDTEFGPFSYHAFIDQSEKFLLVAFRGSLTTDPAKSLREALGVTAAAKRGTGKVEILELSDFQCPTCAHAHEKLEPLIKQNLSKMSYTRLDLPLFENHDWAIPAAMGARAIQRVAPAKYWQYVDYVFKNQEQIGQRKNFELTLKEWLEDNDVPWAAVQKIYASKTERAALLDQVSRAFAIGVASTPTFIVNGQIMGFGPDGTFTMDAIKSAIGVSTAAAAPKKGK
ncbi:MAG TPA: thioredoxin domain-containing protein [Thermoanaerobaculia bacterium]|jgi:protein-disulfide isomerase|nr:thioredoxin domain-containing protein [Thermoanaerobaculia bacterium]